MSVWVVDIVPYPTQNRSLETYRGTEKEARKSFFSMTYFMQATFKPDDNGAYPYIVYLDEVDEYVGTGLYARWQWGGALGNTIIRIL
jgi:hypothetical protein